MTSCDWWSINWKRKVRQRILSFLPNFLKNIKVQHIICYITSSFLTNTRYLSKLGPILIVDSNIIYSLDGLIYIEHKKLYLLSINFLATSAWKYYIIIQGKQIQLHASFFFIFLWWMNFALTILEFTEIKFVPSH